MCEWISVTKSLPKDGKEVLITDRNGCVDIMHRYNRRGLSGWDDGKDWCLNDKDAEDSSFSIVAWMPLPEPYEAD